MSNFPSLAASHIANIAKAKSLNEATQMGFIDRIIDYFNNGVKREAIVNIFNAINTMQRGAEYHVGTGNNAPRSYIRSIDQAERVDLFLQLRELALPEQRHQFQFDIYENANGKFGVSMTIAGEPIYKNDDIYESTGDGQLPHLFMAKLQMTLEDATRAEDPERLLRTLFEFDKFLTTQIPNMNEKGNPYSADQRREFRAAKIDKILNGISSETKAMILAAGTSNFGGRIRGVLDLGSEALTQASNEVIIISTSNSADSDARILLIDDKQHSALLSTPLNLGEHYENILVTCAEQLHAEQALLSGLESKNLELQDNNMNAPSLRLNTVEINSRSELTEAETRGLNTIGIPESILRVI